MLETLVPLIIDTGGDPNFDVNIPDNIVPDAGRSTVYTFRQSYQSTAQYIWTHDLVTGLFVEKNLPTFPDSANNRFQAGTAVLVGGYLYVVSYQVADDKATLHLSKLDPATMAEVDSVPLAAAGYVFALVDFKTCAFTLGGTNYVAVALSAATGAPIEVFDVDAMTSMDVFDYPDEGGDCWLVAGQQPTSTTQKLYILADGFPAGDEPPFISLTFTSTTGLITGATVATISASSIDAGWLDPSELGAHPIDISALMFDASDGNVIFAAWNQDWATQGGTPGYIVKLNSATGAVVWTVPVPYIPNYFDQSARLSDLSEGTLIFVPPVSVVWPGAVYGAIPADTGVYYTINTATGSYETAFSSHFSLGPENSAIATEHAQQWDSVNGRFFYFSSGPESDWQDDGTYAVRIGDPWYEGWAMFAVDAIAESSGESDCPSSGFDLTYPPCVTTWTQCVKIARRDGITFRFTSLDQDFDFRGETYLTCGGLDPSATQTTAQLGEVGNTELAGLIKTTGVDEAELYGGLFDDAFVEVWLVDFEGADEPRRLGAGWAGKITQSTRGYRMEVLGPGARLEQKPIVQVYSPQCRWVFGDDRCTIDLESLAVAGTVTSGLNRGVFTATLGSPLASGTGAVASSGDVPAQFANGKVVWLTGVNAGQTTETKEADFDTGVVTLWALTVHVPEAGDTFSIYPGCNQDLATCKDVFDNVINFGGFPYVPGMDAILKTPDQKIAR